LKIGRLSIHQLAEYGTVPISFQVRSRLVVDHLTSRLTDGEIDEYQKDYDHHPEERPSEWARRFDLSKWVFFAAYDDDDGLVGAAAAVCRSAEIDMLDGRSDLVCLWDIRVVPNLRRSGVGKGLFEQVEQWGRENGCTELTVETQDINVPACRFYQRMGCSLHRVNPNAYPPDLNEVQLIWRKRI